MYAIIEESGTQMRVEEGQELDIDYREAIAGEELTFDRVLACRDDSGLKLGRPLLDGVTVTAKVLGLEQGEKLSIGKLRRRKNSRTRTGHRQMYTRVKVEKINAG